MYVSVSTRPDLAFLIGVVARNLHVPIDRHMRMAKRVLRRVRGTSHFGITYRRIGPLAPSSLSATVDANWT